MSFGHRAFEDTIFPQNLFEHLTLPVELCLQSSCTLLFNTCQVKRPRFRSGAARVGCEPFSIGPLRQMGVDSWLVMSGDKVLGL